MPLPEEMAPSKPYSQAASANNQSPKRPLGFRFDHTPPSRGYTWWYIDGVSADGQNALVLILFVGSVFSPYYAWNKWADPSNHCALNVALYGQPHMWSMTERRAGDVSRQATSFQIGNSQVDISGNRLEIEISEIGAPIPKRMRGKVSVTLPYQTRNAFQLDPHARHFWSPACAHAQVAIDFEAPGLSWSGEGYVDMNYGSEPLEKGFDYWDWSRTPLADGRTLIRYVTDPKGSDQRRLHLLIAPDGHVEETSGEADCALPGTNIWRIKRRAGLLENTPPTLVKTLEDTPFYSRSLIDYGPGSNGLTTHETLSCRRLSSPIVKAMLPFRMPRLSL